MKVTCPKDELTRALAVVGRAVSTRATVQVLGGVLLRGGEGSLELAATDMELSLRLSVEAQVEGQGAVVAPGRLLVDLARLLPDNEVVLEHRAEQGVLEITCGPAAYKLNTYSAEDFPKLPEVEGAQTFTVDNAAFLDTVSKVARAASRDESRPVLTGVMRPLRGLAPRHGRDRLVPNVGQNDRARGGRGRRARGDRPRPGADRALADRHRTPPSSGSASRRTTSCSAPETSG